MEWEGALCMMDDVLARLVAVMTRIEAAGVNTKL